METVSYTEARSHFRKTMESVCDSHEPVIITRRNERPVVMVSLEDYNAMEETLYLLRSPENARRLSNAVDNIKQGNISAKTLLDDQE